VISRVVRLRRQSEDSEDEDEDEVEDSEDEVEDSEDELEEAESLELLLVALSEVVDDPSDDDFEEPSELPEDDRLSVL
jgi:hypothetical protein